VFDSQVAFNMVARYGAHSQPALEAVELRILAHFRAITLGRVAVPSLVLVQAPIFHAHVFSIYIEMEQEVASEDLARALVGEHVAIAAPADDIPSNVAAAGQEQVLVSVRRDPAKPSGFFLWAAADNLRVAALTAVDCAATLALARPRGAVQ
ncbi:MAG: Asd/ArgC dimerization domain-containing protein, partial [Terriglobales bacterium]